MFGCGPIFAGGRSTPSLGVSQPTGIVPAVTAKAEYPSRVRSVRADSQAWEVLDWWASIVGVPLGTLLRAAIEDVANEVIAAVVNEIDESLPDDMLLKRVRHRVQPPHPPKTIQS